MTTIQHVFTGVSDPTSDLMAAAGSHYINTDQSTAFIATYTDPLSVPPYTEWSKCKFIQGDLLPPNGNGFNPFYKADSEGFLSAGSTISITPVTSAIYSNVALVVSGSGYTYTAPVDGPCFYRRITTGGSGESAFIVTPLQTFAGI